MRIDSIENRHGDFVLSAIHLLKAFKHLGLGLWNAAKMFNDRVIKRYSLVVVAVVIFVSTLFSTIQIGKARAERDKVSRELYLANKKIEKLENN